MNTKLHIPRLVLAALCMSLLSGCFRPDHRTIVVAVPKMASPACFAEIQKALAAVEGIEGAKPDYESRTIAISYNALKLGIKNIEFVVAGAGFDANETKAPENVKANLPEGCR